VIRGDSDVLKVIAHGHRAVIDTIVTAAMITSTNSSTQKSKPARGWSPMTETAGCIIASPAVHWNGGANNRDLEMLTYA
jgi:hypothetical protein